MNKFDFLDGDAIILSGGILESKSAKTTHGLVRGSDRFKIKAIIDRNFAGKRSVEVIEKAQYDVPIYESVDAFLKDGGEAAVCIIGVATKGGVLPEEMRVDVRDAISNKIAIINGLHKFLNDDQEMADLAKKNEVVIHDIRRPRPKTELAFWTGDIFQVMTPKIAVMGTDCGLGKRTTAKFVVDALRKDGHSAEMIFTGQTGWLQGWKYGFILDSTVNDFVSGELEDAMLRCHREVNPDFMVIEGQAALRNISGPCGAEFLISGNVDGVILHHSPVRKYYHGYDHLGVEIPPLDEEIKLVEAYGKQVIGATLNTFGVEYEQAAKFRDAYESQLKIPVALPIDEGVDRLIPALTNLLTVKK